MWWVGAHGRKKRTFFVTFISPEENFFNICVLSQCIVFWIHFQNIYSFTYQKSLLHTLSCLFLKSLKAFSVSLSRFLHPNQRFSRNIFTPLCSNFEHLCMCNSWLLVSTYYLQISWNGINRKLTLRISFDKWCWWITSWMWSYNFS